MTNVKALAVALIFSLMGCDRATERTISADVIAEDFVNPNATVVASYRQKWEGTQLTELDRTILAGELLRADQGRGAEYLAHLRVAINSQNAIVSAAAVSSLRNARGDDALELLVKMATSPRPEVARAAGHALNFRRREVEGGDVSSREAKYLETRIEQLCARQPLASYVRELICR